MIASDIIKKFELTMDDSTDLSSDEELALLNKVYQKVCADRPWEFLKKEATATASTSLPYVSLPADFQYVISNYDQTDTAMLPVVFVGDTHEPYKIVNWSTRRTYRDKSGYAYIDLPNSRLVFTVQPTSTDAIEYDYMSFPTALTLTDSPIFPDRFHDMLYHAMCVEDNIIQMSDKAKSYAAENQQKYKSYFDDMCYWNANNIII
jgi:hypothetical protein